MRIETKRRDRSQAGSALQGLSQQQRASGMALPALFASRRAQRQPLCQGCELRIYIVPSSTADVWTWRADAVVEVVNARASRLPPHHTAPLPNNAPSKTCEKLASTTRDQAIPPVAIWNVLVQASTSEVFTGLRLPFDMAWRRQPALGSA